MIRYLDDDRVVGSVRVDDPGKPGKVRDKPTRNLRSLENFTLSTLVFRRQDRLSSTQKFSDSCCHFPIPTLFYGTPPNISAFLYVVHVN